MNPANARCRNCRAFAEAVEKVKFPMDRAGLDTFAHPEQPWIASELDDKDGNELRQSGVTHLKKVRKFTQKAVVRKVAALSEIDANASSRLESLLEIDGTRRQTPRPSG